jgi:hypothetical protein
LAEAEDALARLDERLSKSPIRDGFINRTHFGDACASLALDGKLVSLEDLVLHDSRMDIRSPTHEVTLARAVLRARRRIAAAAPDWALSPQGLAAVRGGGGSRTDQEKEGTEEREDAGEREWLGAPARSTASLRRSIARWQGAARSSRAATFWPSPGTIRSFMIRMMARGSKRG